MFDFDARDLPESQATRTFRSHANYLHAFALIVRGALLVRDATALERVAGEVAAVTWARSGAPLHEATLRGCLTRAWSTELLLAVGRGVAGEDELLRLTNSWAVVQAYYASYSATQSLLVAEGKPRPTTHPKTQAQAVDLWVTRAAAVAPWSFAMTSPLRQRAAADGSINGPGRALREVLQWTTCDPDSCWDIAGLALRTTRGDAVDEALAGARQRKLAVRKRAWRAEQEQRRAEGARALKEPEWPSTAKLTHAESEKVATGVRPFTLLDYLYRLRVKANYEDATVFIDGPEGDVISAQVARDLELLAAATLLAHELRVGQQIGRDKMLALVDGWLTGPGRWGDAVALAARREVLDRYL